MKKHFLKELVSPSITDNAEQVNISFLFKRLLVLFIALSIVMLLFSLFIRSNTIIMLSVTSLISFSFSLTLLLNNQSENAAVITSGYLMMLGLFSIYTGNGIHDTAIFLFPPFFLIASFLLRRIMFLVLSFFALFCLILIGIAEYTGIIVNNFSGNSTFIDIVILGVLGIATIVIIHLFSMRLQQVLDYAQKNAKNYQKIFNSVSEAIIINDTETGNIIHVNKPMLFMFEYQESDIAHIDMNTLTIGNDDLTFIDVLSNIKKSNKKQPQIYTWYGKKRSGEHFLIELSISLTIIDGFERVLTVIRDVDEKSKFDEKVQQNEKMIALGRLAGGIAHDFRNQLTGIMGCAELLKAEIKNDSHQEALNLIIQSAHQSTELTQQLLFFSRKGETEYQPLNINEIINSTISILKRSIDKRIEIAAHLNNKTPMILGDAGRIQNTLLNLCLNARDAMPNGGSLKVKTDIIDVDDLSNKRLFGYIPPSTYLAISVSDTGIGIPNELHQKIFEPLFTTKPIGKGTGMGLSAVYGTIREHGGSIELISTINKGSTFILYFPIAKKKEEKSAAYHPVFQGILKIPYQKAIVIDDDPTVRMTISKMLHKIGLDVIPFSDGISAVDYYKCCYNAIDLIFLDINMPLINGHDTFYMLKQINSNVNVYIISGSCDQDEIDNISDSGIRGYIKKPFRIDLLVEMVKNSINRNKQNTH